MKFIGWILGLVAWFLWAFIFGGLRNTLKGNVLEGLLLLITFVEIFIVPIIVYFFL